MRPGRVLFFIPVALVFVTIVIAGFGSAVWQLWNHLMPAIFGLPAIGFWQAVGLLALSWLLFGGMRGPFGPMGPKGRGRWPMKTGWPRLSPEAQEELRDRFRERCER